jgi:putative DNA primase/helicase
MNMHNVPHMNGSPRPQVISFDRRPAPVALDAEAALLGAVLVENAAFAAVNGRVDADHFVDPIHQRLFVGMTRLDEAGKRVTPFTLRAECDLTTDEMKYVGSLAANATTVINAPEYANIVRETAARRRLIAECSSAIDAAHSESVPIDDLLRTTSAELALIRGETASESMPPVMFRRLADIDVVPIRWLWQHRVALGKIAILAGDPGLGKSQISCLFAAAVTTGGAWPDNTRAPQGSVIFICCEDDAADTIKPRLEAAGADCEKILMYDWTSDRDGSRQHFDVGQHIEALSALVREIGDVRLIVIDPISAYMGGADSHVVADVRHALAPLQAMAGELGPAILMVSHLNKGGGAGGAMNRVSGSGAFVAVARSAWLVAKDPQDESERRRILTPLKNNLGDDQTGFAYRLEGWASGDITSSRVVFDPDPVAVSAEDLLQRQSGSGEDGSALAEACDFLRDELTDGSKPSKQIEAAARDAGVSGASLKRARKQLGVKAKKDENGRWQLELPHRGNQGGQGVEEGQEFHDR